MLLHEFAASDSPRNAKRGKLLGPVPRYLRGRRRCVIFQGREIIRFTGRPGTQELIAEAFEDQNWQPLLTDPLPLKHGVVPKRRLNETIKNLNRRQKPLTIRFRGDGTGEGVTWEPA